MKDTFAIHQWDNGNGLAGTRLLASHNDADFIDVALTDPRIPDIWDRLGLAAGHPMRRGFEREQEKAILALLASLGICLEDYARLPAVEPSVVDPITPDPRDCRHRLPRGCCAVCISERRNAEALVGTEYRT